MRFTLPPQRTGAHAPAGYSCVDYSDKTDNEYVEFLCTRGYR
jgi:hypothetical protein